MRENDAKETGGSRIRLEDNDAMRFLLNVYEIMEERLPWVPRHPWRMTRIFRLGLQAYLEANKTETFSVAVEKYLVTKTDLRPSSRRECRAVLMRLMREVPEIRERSLREMQTCDCIHLIDRVYKTPHTRDKARRLLSGFFSYAVSQNWCADNPVSRMRGIRKTERELEVLTIEQIKSLLRQAASEEHADCAAAVGIMLWAGVRPEEVARLSWGDIDMEEKVIVLQPRHSKTGGCRHVTISRVLWEWLNRWAPGHAETDSIIPRSWPHKWRALRQAAGLYEWRGDTLRHTFASYHLRHLNNIDRLQLEMGHSNAKLLFTRYLNMSRLSKAAAAEFWDRSLARIGLPPDAGDDKRRNRGK